MSMTNTSPRLTICEIIRTLNDMHQKDTEHDKAVREKLSTIEYMAKRMVRKLAEYKNAKELRRELFPDINEDYNKLRKYRKSKDYKVTDGKIPDDEMGRDI